MGHIEECAKTAKQTKIIDGFEFSVNFEMYEDDAYFEEEWPVAVPKEGRVWYGYVFTSMYKGECIHIFVSNAYGGVFPMEAGKTYFRFVGESGKKTKEAEIDEVQKKIERLNSDLKRLTESAATA